MPPSKTVRFAEEEEHINTPTSTIDIPSTSSPNHDARIPYADSIPSQVRSSAVSSGSGSQHTPTPSTPSSALPATPPSHPPLSPDSFASTPPPTTPSSYPKYPAHPALAPPYPLITFDVSIPPSLQDIDPVLLAQPATSAPKPMEIFCEGFPWRIVIQLPQDHIIHPRITISDVFERVYDSMEKTVTENEIERARLRAGDTSVHAVMEAYARRDPDGRQRLKRMDFLLGNNRFAGMEVLDAERNYWRLHVAA